MLDEVVKKLTSKEKTIATMESCTGGGLANAITNIEGSSAVLKYSAVTYSNKYKVKMGVPKEIIETYTVYSMETAIAMAHTISEFASSDYGVGITGKLARVDENNLVGNDNQVFVCIYEKEKDKDHTFSLFVTKKTREENKKQVIDEITRCLVKIC